MTVALLMVASPAWADANFIVNSTGDEGDNNLGNGTCATAPFQQGTEPNCTLRAAIQEANTTTASDTINFNIGGSGVKTIEVGKPPAGSTAGNGALPPITQPVTIDGYSQRPCSEGNPAPCSRPNTKEVGSNAVLLIELDGSIASSPAGSVRGLDVQTGNSTIRGLVVNRFDSSGISNLFTTAGGNKIEGNFIGTDPSGTRDLGNGGGVLFKSSNTTVGGTSPAARNLISGNSAAGVGIETGAEGGEVLGNYIGTMKDGTTALGNGLDGVILSGASGGTVAANTIAFNGGEGVQVFHTPGNRILSNSIHSNGGLGIDLGFIGVTPNDAGDGDPGANNLQNYPTITRATTSRSTGRSIVRGTLNSTPITTFTIQLFMNSAPDPSGFGEGQRLLRELSVRTDASGNASFGMKARKLRGFISATATNDSTGDTSEFSLAKKVVR
jgi:CSLREA domain-containing protein